MRSLKFGKNLVAMGMVAAVLNIAMIGILYVLFGRVLNLLAVLASGLSDLEHRSYDVRLPQLQARELAGISRPPIQRAGQRAGNDAPGKSVAQSSADYGTG